MAHQMGMNPPFRYNPKYHIHLVINGYNAHNILEFNGQSPIVDDYMILYDHILYSPLNSGQTQMIMFR